MKILIAEDEPITLATMELRLTKDGHEVISTDNGQDALGKLSDFMPDLVITDIMMPFASGLEVLSFVKKLNARIPVIVLSAMGQENVVLEAFTLGADDYITKPFSPNELALRVKRFAMRIS
ncbi:response regulator transcription factor [Pontibacter fetidus]|uniref:Response regulator n=1 Tax=Pontibacter fetidus TaxID=2700082 RepID=A0A6B2GZV3_9BACT|nr:response regulator [Pontibacter fetidus]NDK55388.1 response regulator [Pontibacter fetidus]